MVNSASTGKVIDYKQFKIAEAFRHLDPTLWQTDDTDEDLDVPVLFGPRSWLRVGGKRVGYTIDDDEYEVGAYTASGDLLDIVVDTDAAKTMFAHWYAERLGCGGDPSGGEESSLQPEAAQTGCTPTPEPDRVQLETFVRVLFKHATPGNWVSLRIFHDGHEAPPARIKPVKLNGNLDVLIDQAFGDAGLAASSTEKLVFCPPIATFTNRKHAGEADLAEGPVLSTECDKAAPAALAKLEAVLGPATLVVASGGEWTNPCNGETEPKLHIHHRLKAPTRNTAEHRMLKEARRLAAMLVGADGTNVPICHPIRWPGSLHRKGTPKLCHIVACNPDAEIDLAWALMRLREAVEAEGLGAEIISFKPRTANTGPANPNNLRAPKSAAVIAALAIIPNNDLEWEEWNYVGLAICGATAGSDEGGEAFAAWSAKSKKKNDPAVTAARWEHYHTSPPNRIGYGTLVYLARKVQPDWDPPPGGAPRSIFDIDANEGPISWDPASLRISYSNIPHRGWLYGLYLIRGEVTIIAAPGGVGKTAFTTGVATAIVTDTVLMDDKIWGTNLKVLSINGEDGKAEVTRRMLAFARAHADKIAVEAPDRFYTIGADDDRIQYISFLQTNEKNRSTLDSNGFAVLESLIDAVRPDVVMLDPLVVFCSGGNMNDGPVMAQVIRKLKKLAIQYNCAILIVHHNRKGGEQGDQESIANAAAIVNLARCAIMPVPMTAQEAPKLGVLPSERYRYFKLVNAKPNFTPKSEDSPWYQLHSIELPNAEPPTYEHGDNVQAVVRVQLPPPKTAAEAADDRKIQKAILDLIDRGKFIEGERYPYSPNITGAKNMRGLLDDALVVVEWATKERQWRSNDLQAVVNITIHRMKADGWITEEEIEKGRFRRKLALHVRWQNTPWPKSDSPADALSETRAPTVPEPTVPWEEEPDPELDREVAPGEE